MEKNSDHWFVCAIFNPMQYDKRYELYEIFRKYILYELKNNLITVELAYADSPFVATKNREIELPNNEIKLQYRKENCNMLWVKEILLNKGFNAAPLNAKYFTFIDADITFDKNNIVEIIINKLLTDPIIQPFKVVSSLDRYGKIMSNEFSFSCVRQNSRLGFCWSFRRDVLEEINGLWEYSILGGGDRFCAYAFVGCNNLLDDRVQNIEYKNMYTQWANKVNSISGGKISYIDSTITHMYHGEQKDRNYMLRNYILNRHNFNPNTDLVVGNDDIPEITSKKPGLIADIYCYFQSRKEGNGILPVIKLEGDSDNTHVELCKICNKEINKQWYIKQTNLRPCNFIDIGFDSTMDIHFEKKKLSVNRAITITQCGHYFHIGCILRTFEKNKKCDVCEEIFSNDYVISLNAFIRFKNYRKK